MNRQFLRTAAGFGSLSALALVMVACGGSSSSAPTTPTNQAPSTPTIVGPTTAITLHPAFYNLSSVDPEGDPITFIVNGTAITGNSYRLDPTAAGTTTLSVQARDNKNPAATSGTATLTVNVAANRPPQFLSQPSGQLTGANSQTINWTNFQVSAQDPDTDDVAYSVVAGTTSFTDVTGGAVSINATTGAVSFTGTVNSGKTVGTATFTVKAEDKLPGTSTLLGASATQIVTLTYFTGNQAPVILTTSLPEWPLNHFIPIAKDASGFPIQASDPNGDSLTWTLDPASVAAGLSLTGTGNSVELRSNVKRTSNAPVSVTVTVNDGKGLTAAKTFTISVVGDAKPTLNSSPYTETVSGVKFFDKSQVKDQITGRPRFYNGADFVTPSKTTNFTYDGRINWISSYAGAGYVAGESNHAVDAKATDKNWNSTFLPAGTDQAVAGWTARTIFRDAEGDGINYTVDSRSVYVSSPLQPVGQPFTLTSVDAALPNVLPILSGYSPIAGTSQGIGEFPTIDNLDGTMTWLPVLHERMNATTGFDNLGIAIYANPSIWSYTVMGFEKVWNPGTSAFEIITDPSQAGRIDYSIKVQPNNRPWIGPALGIPGAIANVPGAAINQVVNPTTSVLIGGGPSAAPNYYGRPSIQEPESRRYDVAAGTNLQYTAGGFDYAAPNTVKPAVWRWLFARAGGDPIAAGKVFGTGFSVSDAQLYDPDTTTVTGHQDAVVADMGTPTFPAADTTGNYPAISANSVTFYNPWLTASNAGDFQVSWGPNRTQYLIARVTASAAYAFPVETRDQYQRLQNRNLGINPIFGTVRFTNSRVRTFADAGTEVSAAKRGGAFTAGNYPGDPVVAAPLASQFTFAYLPFPSNGASSDETNFGSFLFAGSGPASGNQASSGLYTAASWITLNATEAPQYGFHTGNPLNDETGTFNLPSYASVLEGSSSTSTREDLRQYNYTWINGANPTNPVAADNYAVGSWANHEVRAQVIPSNSPYLFSFYGTSMPANYFNTYPTELAGSTLMTPLRNFFNGIVPAAVGPTGHWYNVSATAHGWVYNLYQGEVDMQNAVAGRGLTLPTAFGNTRLRWTYSWPTQVTNSNLGSATGQVNNWKLGDVMQIAIPNHGSNGRYFFVGDGGPNDPQAANVIGWGFMGQSAATDSEAVVGSAVYDGFGTVSATNTPFHVASNSLWIYNNFNGAGTTGFLNTPNRTSFSPGASSTQLPFSVGARGYMKNNVAGGFQNVDPGYFGSWGQATAIPGLVSTGAGDRMYFLWLRQDEDHKTAWGNWDSSLLVGGGSTYTATGGLTTVPDFSMTDNAVNSMLPASYASEAQVSMAAGNLPGQNHAANVFVSSDASLYNASIISPSGWARSQWGFMAPTLGYQPAGTNNVRLVNPAFDTTNVLRWNNVVAQFRDLNPATVSYEGGVRDSAIVYGVRRHTDEKGNANAELGLAGIEPGSPLLAQWYNIQLGGDMALDGATIANTATSVLNDIGTGWPAVFEFYSPFTNDPAWANVMEYKMNYLVGMTYPGTQLALGGTLWKVPAQAANVFELSKPLTDASCTNPNNTVNPGNPIVRPIEFLRISDYTSNTVASSPSVRTTLDLVNSDPTNMAGAGSFVLGGGSSTFIQARGNVRVTFQASVNNQVLPSGYVIEIFQLPGDGTLTNQPILLGSVRAGHLGGKDAIQRVYLPSMHSFSGLTAAAYFFRIRTVWHQGVNFEKQPTKQSIPMGYADYVSSPFVTQ